MALPLSPQITVLNNILDISTLNFLESSIILNFRFLHNVPHNKRDRTP